MEKMAIIRKGNTHLLTMQILVSSTCSLGGHPAVQLSLTPTQKYVIELQSVMSSEVKTLNKAQIY